MDKKIKISIVVPAYNIEKYIARCIESILNQTYKNLEIIVIDDGSTDRTSEIVDEYAKKDNRIVVIHQKNAGLVAVREKGIDIATGQYIGFVDGDDEVEEYMYEKLLKNATNYKAEISQCGILTCFYEGRKEKLHGTGKLYVFNREEGYRELMRGTLMEPSLCNKIYRRDILENSCLDKNIVNNEDFLRNAVAFCRVDKSILEDFCGYHYWRRFGSVSNNIHVVKNRKEIINARRIVMDNADEEMWEYAFEAYVIAVIGAYNMMIGKKDQEALKLKNECKKELLGGMKTKFSCLRRGIRFRAYGILYLTVIYDLSHKGYGFVKEFENNRRKKVK